MATISLSALKAEFSGPRLKTQKLQQNLNLIVKFPVQKL